MTESERNPRRFDVVVVGGANWDYLIRGPELPHEGETVQGETFDEGPGGKGCNQAVAAARLGARVAFVGQLGTDERGDRIHERLVAERVDVTRVKRDSKAPTGIALVMVDQSGQKQIQVAPGANHRLTPQDIRDAANVIADTRVLLIQLEIPLDTVLAALTIAREAGVRTVLDPAPPMEVPRSILDLVDVIKPNASEAKALTGIDVDSRSTARKAAMRLRELGPGIIVVQAGAEGDLIVSEDEDVWLPRLPVKSVDATGAGDAFAAALAVMLAAGEPLARSGAFASATAALESTGIGAQAPLPTKAAVSQFLEEQARS